MRLSDVDRRRRTVTVRLKGARDEHRVPVTPDWWALLEEYLSVERGAPDIDALWVGRRQAAGRPLRYPAFEVSLRATAARLGVHATAHMFRHTVAQHLVEIAGLTVAKEVLGHQHVSTTAEEYAHVDEAAMLAALTEVARRQRRSLLHVGETGRSGMRSRIPQTRSAPWTRSLTGLGDDRPGSAADVGRAVTASAPFARDEVTAALRTEVASLEQRAAEPPRGLGRHPTLPRGQSHRRGVDRPAMVGSPGTRPVPASTGATPRPPLAGGGPGIGATGRLVSTHFQGDDSCRGASRGSAGSPMTTRW